MINNILAIDPGPEQSAVVRLTAGWTVQHYGTLRNPIVMALLDGSTGLTHEQTILVLEEMQSYGMPVGREILQAVFWSGRFVQAWIDSPWIVRPTDATDDDSRWALISRPRIKGILCHDASAKDANVRQALIDRFGVSKKAAVGTKLHPGSLHGVSGHAWSALAVAVAWFELNGAQETPCRH